MLFQENMIVVVTNGKNAGKKAVVLKVPDDKHVIVAGINRLPQPIEDHMSKAVKAKNSKFLIFIKKYNVKHVLATRYKTDIGLSEIDVDEISESLEAKKTAVEQAQKIMKKAREENKSKFLFSVLNF